MLYNISTSLKSAGKVFFQNISDYRTKVFRGKRAVDRLSASSIEIKTVVLVYNSAWALCNFRMGVIRTLLINGYRVVAITPFHEKYVKQLIEAGCEHIPLDLDSQGTNILKDLNSILNLINIYSTVKPDFIFHYTVKLNIYGTIAAFLNRIPSVAVICGTGYTFLKKDILYHFVKTLYKIALPKARQVWFVNSHQKSFFEKENIVLTTKTSLLEGEGVDITFFKPDAPKFEDSSFVFLLTGRMIWDKGIKEYAEAAKILKNKYDSQIECHLLGFTDCQNPHAIPKAIIDKWHTEGGIKYLGESDDVRFYLNAADCFVLPSYYCEGVPRSLLEAASMEKPIITTDNVGCIDVVQNDYNGLIVKSKDVSDLVKKMEKMFFMKSSDREKMGKNGRQKVIKGFEESLVIKHYLEILKTI